MIPPPDDSARPAGENPSPEPTPKPALKPDKRPLPLLSRAKLKRPRQLSEEEAAGGTDAKAPARAARPSRRTPLAVRLLLRVVAYAALVGLGYAAVHLFRQTQVQGLVVAPPGCTLPGEVYLVRDFSDDVRTLRGEYQSASEPFEADLRSKQDSLHRVEADLNGLNQRKALIVQQLSDDQKEIEAAALSSQNETARIWQADGGALDAEQDSKLAAFRAALEAKAKTLGLTLVLDDQPASPEVWVNAFRLALYNPPPAIKAPEQRAWLEKQLVDWHAYEKDCDARRGDIKAKTDAARQALGAQIADAKLRMDRRHAEIADAESTAVPLQTEYDNIKAEELGAEARERQQRAAYADQLASVPTRNVIERFPLAPQGRFSWTHLEQQTKYAPGTYYLWTEVRKGAESYWALVPFTVKEYSRLDLILKPGAFLPAADLLK